MTDRILRLRILRRLAQVNSPEIPTDEVAKTTSVSGSPPSFNALDSYPSIITAFQSKNVPWINGLGNLLNTCLYYTSNGKVTLPWMKSNNFNFDASQVPSVDLKNLMNLTKLVYTQLFTNLGQPYKAQLTPLQIAEKISNLNSNQFLNNLSSIQSGGQINTKIGGNVKNLIQNYLLQIK
jgi:hypothetical protein